MRNLSLVHALGLLLALLAAAALLAPPASLAQDKDTSSPPPDKPSGRVTLTLGQGGLLLGASGGRGTLYYRHRTHAFELGGIGIGEFGGARADCEGEVYNLTRLEDFPGAYVQLKSGHTGTTGRQDIWLKNSNGVEIWLRAKTSGLDLTAEGEGVVIKFKEGRRK